MGKKVYAVYEGDADALREWSPYLTAGKRYEVSRDSGFMFDAVDDTGSTEQFLWEGCAHLPPSDAKWTRIEE